MNEPQSRAHVLAPLLASVLVPAAALALAVPAHTHGGTYPGGSYGGPGDTVPPGGGGGSGPAPATPGPAPATPGPSGPSTPGPAAPGSPGAPASGPSGVGAPLTGAPPSAPDLLAWDYWWTFNRHAYLDLRRALYARSTLTGSDDFFLGRGERSHALDVLRPSDATVRESVVPALVRALETEQSNDVLTGALVALAKIGEERAGRELVPLFSELLKDGNQEVAETAAIALGIAAGKSSVRMLADLLDDALAARRWIGKDEVPPRTRAFAAYGLGLVGARTDDEALRRSIVARLAAILDGPQFATRDVKVAAVTAFGLTPLALEAPPDEAGEARGLSSREDQIAWLMDYFDERNTRANARTRHWFVRAHVPAALARLLADAPSELRAPAVELLLDGIREHSKLPDELRMGCVLALGRLGDAGTSDSAVRIRAELERTATKGDQQSRRFALIALAQTGARAGSDPGSGPDGGPDARAGTDDVRATLLRHLSRGKTQMKPWAALALGVLGRGLLDDGLEPDPETSLALRTATDECRRPSEVGAYLIALGMRRDPECRELLREKLEFFRGSVEAQGYVAVALGMTGDRAAIETLREIVERSRYRPELMRMAAIGLGLLGDKELVPELTSMLAEAKGLATQASVATALGSIGDARSIGPLVDMLGNDQLTARGRAFAAAALGIVCDSEELVFNAKISRDINYRANTVTLTGAGQGVLDIL